MRPPSSAHDPQRQKLSTHLLNFRLDELCRLVLCRDGRRAAFYRGHLLRVLKAARPARQRSAALTGVARKECVCTESLSQGIYIIYLMCSMLDLPWIHQ